MRTRTITLVEFDSMEFQTLQRVEPSIRIGFPTDAIEQAVRDAQSASDVRNRVKQAKQQWEGRWLKQVCSTKQEWDAKAINYAWACAITLEAVLDEQSAREYWERTLKPDRPASEGQPIPAADVIKSHSGGGVGLIAPGADVCGMLAETRGAQLRDLRAALPILEAAKEAVGPLPEERLPIKYEEV